MSSINSIFLMNTVIWYLLLFYILAALVLYFFQHKFIFKPEKLHKDFSYIYDIPFRELNFKVAEGVTINGLHFYQQQPHGLVLYFHGNSRSIKGWAKYAKDFSRYGYDVVLVDYRGFGKSTGRQGEKQMMGDMQFVYSHLAGDNDPRYLILDAPFYNFKKAVERFLPLMPVRILLRYKMRSDIWLRTVQCHTYIIHGTKDWLIPISNSEALQKLNPRTITLIRIHGGGHNNLPSFNEYHAFLRDILAP